MKGFGDRDKDKSKKNNLSKEQIINRAFKLHSEGNIQEASKYYKYFLNQGFKDHRVFSNYGIILQSLGKIQEAEIYYRKAINIQPNFADAYSNLGILLKNLRKLEEAELALRKAIQINPNLTNAYCNLGNVLQDLGKIQEAELALRKAIQINPNLAMAYSNLGNVLQDLGKIQEAELALRKAIQINPNLAMAYSNLGNILQDLGKIQEAELALRKAIQINPNLAMAYSNLGNVLQDLGKIQEAELALRKAIQINPNLAMAYSNLGNVLQDLGKIQEAELAFKKVIQINPNSNDAFFNLFLNYEKTNNLKELKESLNKFCNQDSIKNVLLLFESRLSFRKKEYQTAKKLINQISNLWIKKININQKIIFWSYKGFIEDKVKNYDTAYSYFKKSQDNFPYKIFNKDSYLNHIDCYKKSVIKKNSKNYNNDNKIEDFKLVFLIGFPRSGTTLLDTILRSHREIQVIEEKPMISVIEKLIKENLKTKLENIFDLSENDLLFLKQQYFELLKKYKTNDANLIIDKLPLNTVCVPLINLIFPKSKIIFTVRHPNDTVLSCFQQIFKPNNAMANFTSLKTSSIIYDKVMSGWDLYKKHLSFEYIESKYENLIEDFDDQTLKVLKFLGIGWDENVKNYRKTALERGKINTPSSSQVVQPLYKSSIEKWKNYEQYFKDCHQYLEKWVSYFEY